MIHQRANKFGTVAHYQCVRVCVRMCAINSDTILPYLQGVSNQLKS